MRWMLLAALLLSGCALPVVYQSDLDAWTGAPLRDLQLHPLFSTLPKRAEALGDGSELWTFSNCTGGTTTCTPGLLDAMNCTDSGPICCHNQFIIRGRQVEQYRVVGRCRTNCSVRPASRPCTVAGQGQLRPTGNPKMPGG